MKVHTSDFKNNIKLFGKEIDSKITFTIGEQEIELGKELLNSVTPHYEGDILKSVMKQLDIDTNLIIPIGTEINYQFGVLVNGSYEYIDFGNYIIYSVEKQEDTKSFKIIAYDKMLYAMKDYESLNIQYPITIKDYLEALCTKIGLDLKDTNFVNYDKEIVNELYLDNEGNSLNYTYRDVLDEIAGATASTICINGDDELEVRYITDTEDTIDEEYLKDINVNFGEMYGPVNSVVLSRSAESDNIYRKDDESIEENGLHEIKIVDNQILNGNNRYEFIDGIFEQLNGFSYYANDFTSTGITYYDLCDRYNVVVDNNTYSCIMMNDEILVTQGLEENIHTDIPEDSETDYKKADKTDRKVNQAWLIVNKQESTIEGLVSKTNILDEGVYTKEQVDNLIITSSEGLTNTFSEAGGNNIFRNTGLWFSATTSEETLFPSTDLYPSEDLFMAKEVVYEFWDGIVVKVKEEKASNMNALLLQNGSVSQEQIVPNGKYTISFKYKKLVPLAVGKVYINDTEYELDEDDDTEFVQVIEVSSQHINVRFYTSIDNGFEIYDIMVNAGEVKLAYSQNQNETTTDTVNISKGITITSSDLDVTFKANADGIRTLDRSGNVLTKFTDTGMETKEAIITEKSQIVGTLWQEVGDQTWITKL